MRINEIKKNEVNVTLDADELVLIQNLIHNYEKACKTDPELRPLNAKAHGFAAQVITANNLCQYGHLDSFALDSILKHNLETNPNARMAQVGRILRPCLERQEQEQDKKKKKTVIEEGI